MGLPPAGHGAVGVGALTVASVPLGAGRGLGWTGRRKRVGRGMSGGRDVRGVTGTNRARGDRKRPGRPPHG